MKKVNVAIISYKGNFNTNLGQGVQKYNYELYKALKKYSSNIFNIKKIELGFGKITSIIDIKNLLFLKKYDIIHIPSPLLFYPKKIMQK